MKNIIVGGQLNSSRMAMGCMRIASMSVPELSALVHTAIDAGITYFDHADIYGGGECEAVFGRLLKAEPNLRSQIHLQSKVGIRQGYYDFSKEHILQAVEGSMQRLGVDTLDALLLHRPDALVEPDEVAEAFTCLEDQGKVKVFGISNQNPSQIELLKRSVPQRLAINQLQFSITNAGMVDSGIHVNMEGPLSVDRDGHILNYCRLHDMVIQPWSPFQFGFFEGVFLDNKQFKELNAVIDKLAEKYSVSNSAIAIAWILRHPAMMQPIIGSTNAKRVQSIAKADDITLTRKEWYDIYLATGKKLP